MDITLIVRTKAGNTCFMIWHKDEGVLNHVIDCDEKIIIYNNRKGLTLCQIRCTRVWGYHTHTILVKSVKFKARKMDTTLIVRTNAAQRVFYESTRWCWDVKRVIDCDDKFIIYDNRKRSTLCSIGCTKEPSRTNVFSVCLARATLVTTGEYFCRLANPFTTTANISPDQHLNRLLWPTSHRALRAQTPACFSI